MAKRASTDALRRLERRVRMRLDARVALRRMVGSIPASLQIVLAATASYAIARYALGHDAPLVAVTVTISSLGFARDARPRRVVENALGILIGIAFAELLLILIGRGIGQFALVLFLTLLVARLASPSVGFAIAAGVQATLVMILPPPDGGVFSRSVDGLVGAAMALLATSLVPRDPRGTARRDARTFFSTMHEGLQSVVAALDSADRPAAELGLARLRRTQRLLDDWNASLDTAIAVARLSPFLRRHLPVLREQSRVLSRMDLAARHLRIIARRIEFLVRDDRPRLELAGVLSQIAAVIDSFGEHIEGGRSVAELRTELETIAKRLSPDLLGDVPVSESVVLVQLRPLVADLLVATGLTLDEARDLLPPID